MHFGSGRTLVDTTAPLPVANYTAAGARLPAGASDNAVPKGYQQITVLTGSTALTVPAGSRYALISVEAQAVRYRDDAVAPTATVGMPLPVGATLRYDGDLAAIRFIEQAAGGRLNVSYYA